MNRRDYGPKGYAGALVLLVGVLAALTFGAVGVARADTAAAPVKTAKPVAGELTQSAAAGESCGTVTITFTNTTNYLFVTGVNVVGGTALGKISVDGRDATGADTASSTFGPFGEQTTVTFGTVEGAERDNYLPFDTFVVEPCPPPTSSTTTDPTTTTDEEPPPSSESSSSTATSEPPEPTDSASRTSSSAGVHYANCDAVRAAGAAPIYPGAPGFATALDGDGDGVGCEAGTGVKTAGGDLAYTGASSALGWLVLGAVALASGGGALLVLARRRARSQD